MSPLEAIRAVKASALRSTEKLVLLCWADHVDKQGRAWPSVAKLARDASLTERGVRKIMSSLRDQGVLVESGADASGTKRYRLDIETLAALDPERRSPPETCSPLNEVPPPLNRVPGRVNPVPPPLNNVPPPPEPCSAEEAIEEAIEEATEEATQRSLTHAPPETPTRAPSSSVASALPAAPEEPPPPSSAHESSVTLSKRSRTALRAVGLSTVGQLSALTASELRSRPGVGPSTVAEVVALLASHGKQLRPEAPKPSPAADAAPYREAWDAAWKAHRRGPYAWDFHRDNRGLMKIAAVAKTPERARRAFDAFLRAHAVGRGVFPYDEAPTIAKFALKPATHVVAADQADDVPSAQRIADEWAALRAGHTSPARDVIDAEPAPDAEELTPIQRMFPGVFDHLTNKEKNR